MNRTLFGYIWQSTKRQQIWILIVILASMPVGFLLLDLPKHIVNGPIQGRSFQTPGATERLFHLGFGLPEWLGGGTLTLYPGHEFDRLGSLVALSIAFLLLVLLNGLFKLYINTYKGRLGERTLQQLRYELFDRVLRFPLGEFRRVKAGEISTMIKDEVEPLGGFIGDAFVQPVFIGGQILTALTFILLQNVPLGLIALGLLTVQGVVIPRLRRRQIELSRQRQLTARLLAGRITEVIEDIPNIRINDTTNYQRADIASQLTAIFRIRFALYQRKYFIKFLNNLLAQVTPFLFYLLGGYFAIRGQLDIGQLVAVIAAYKDLPSPVKELIDWDQQRLDVEVKYHQVVDQFTVEGLEAPQRPPEGDVAFEGELAVSNLAVTDYSGTRLLDGLSFRMGLGDIVAVVGPARGGAETLAEVLARLTQPSSGHIQIAGKAMQDWPDCVLARKLSFAGPDTYYPQSTLVDALCSGLQHGPPVGDEAGRDPPIVTAEGLDLDFAGDWINYALAGVSDRAGLLARLGELLKMVDLHGDVLRLGLNRRLAEGAGEDIEQRFVAARRKLQQRLASGDMMALVEPFDPARYNRQSSVAENLLFGTARNGTFATASLASNRMLRDVLRAQELTEDLFDMGRDIARTIGEVFEGLAPDNPLFARLALVPADRLPVYTAALTRIGKGLYRHQDEADRALFLDLAFSYVEPRDRLGMLDEAMETRIVAARQAFHAALGEEQADIAFYDPDAYNVAATIQDNILLGRIAHGVAQADARVQAELEAVIAEGDLVQAVFETGLGFNIGNGGRRLTSVQRQKLTLARALLRRPALLIAHRTLSSLDAASQTAIIERVLATARGEEGQPGFGVLAILGDARAAEHFDRVLVLDDGKLAEDGAPSSLRSKGGYLMKLVA